MPEETEPVPPTPPVYVTGLDLGQSNDYSALVVVERNTIPDPDPMKKKAFRFDVRHLHRWPLGTPYPQIVTDTKAMFAEPPLKDTTLVVDETGVGRPVVDLFRAADIGAHLKPMTITHGEGGKGPTVAKKNLVAAVQVPLQARRLRIAESLPLADVLAKELEQFRVKVTAARNEVYEAWRERDHDDLVLALALACWYAAKRTGDGIAISIRDIPPPLPPVPIRMRSEQGWKSMGWRA